MTPEVQAAVERLEGKYISIAPQHDFDIHTVIQALRDAEQSLADARKRGQVEALEWAGHKMAAENVKCGELVIGKVCNCSCGAAKELVPSEHVPGLGCLCGASSSFECDCEIVDWRSRREVELEAENAKLRKVVEAAKEFSLSAERTLSLISCKEPNCLRPFCKMDSAITELEQIRCNNTNLKQG